MIQHKHWQFEREEDLDECLRQRAQGGFAENLETCELVQLADSLQRWAKTGHKNLPEYLESVCGLNYRSLRRYLSIVEALATVGEPLRKAVRDLLLAMGAKKASILAPWIEEQGEAVTVEAVAAWAEQAAGMTEAAFQEAVTTARGAKPRGAAGDAEAQVLKLLLSVVPPERYAWAERVYRMAARVAETTNPIYAYLVALELLAQDLAHQGHPVEG